jgi:hypothetical protein
MLFDSYGSVRPNGNSESAVNRMRIKYSTILLSLLLPMSATAKVEGEHFQFLRCHVTPTSPLQEADFKIGIPVSLRNIDSVMVCWGACLQGKKDPDYEKATTSPLGLLKFKYRISNMTLDLSSRTAYYELYGSPPVFSNKTPSYDVTPKFLGIQRFNCNGI